MPGQGSALQASGKPPHKAESPSQDSRPAQGTSQDCEDQSGYGNSLNKLGGSMINHGNKKTRLRHDLPCPRFYG